MTLSGLFDLLLAAAVVVLAWQAMRARRLFTGIVMFVLFGMLITLAWVRLHAPDIALAEAVIGTGLTGAMLMAALGRFEKRRALTPPPPAPPTARLTAIGNLLMAAGLLGLLSAYVQQAASATAGLGPAARAAVSATGIGNPVTGVVLDLRGYDTLIEIGVLFLALLGLRTIHPRLQADAGPAHVPSDPLLAGMIHLFAPIIITFAGYTMWTGTNAPGGAFQAGALLASLGVMMTLSGLPPRTAMATAPLRACAAIGFTTYALVAGLCLFDGALLQYPPPLRKSLMLLIEVTCTLSIATILLTLFYGCGLMGAAAPAEEVHP